MKQLNVGIIGFGVSGRYFFAPFINAHSGFNLQAIVTSQTSLVGALYPEINVYETVDSLLSDNTIDLVVVASPNYTHFDLAKAALIKGKHVIVEKPFTTTVLEAEELIALAESQGLFLIPFQNRRWDGDFLAIKQLIHNNVLGEVLEFESHFDRYRPGRERADWKNQVHPGVSLLYDIGPHLIDQALSLFGKPEMVFGDIRIQRTEGVTPDYFEMQLFYNRLKVILKAGVMCREIGPRFIIHGTRGSFVKHGLDVQEKNLKDGLLPGDPLLGKDKEENYGLLHTEIEGVVVRKNIETHKGDYMAYFENVYNAICGNEELIVTPEQAKITISLIEKAIQSSREKRLITV
jgi:predicted dehydrogenase